MSTDYIIYEHNATALLLTEQSNRFSIHGENRFASVLIAEALSTEEILNIAHEIFKVASYFAEPDLLEEALASMKEQI